MQGTCYVGEQMSVDLPRVCPRDDLGLEFRDQ
jgi:hypothetical protein